MGSKNQKHILLIFRHAPYGNAIAREGLEAALAFGAMGVKASVLYMNDGVWQLLPKQESQAIAAKNHAAMSSALPLYDIDKIWIDGDSLHQRSIDSKDIQNCGDIISCDELCKLIATSDVILSF